MGTTARPRLLVCYLCGREYGSKSLGIHIPQCRKMFEAQEAKKPKGTRRKIPTPPPGYLEALSNVVLVPSSPLLSGDGGNAGPGVQDKAPFGSSITADALNDAAYATWSENVLETCQHCQRTFTPEAMTHHAKACTMEHPAKPRGTALSSGALSHRLSPGIVSGTNRPRLGLVSEGEGEGEGGLPSDYGASGGTSLDSGRQLNATRPISSGGGGGGKGISTSRGAARVPENTLKMCQHCRRTFTPDAIAHHSKACTADRPMKPRSVDAATAAPAATAPGTLPQRGSAPRKVESDGDWDAHGGGAAAPRGGASPLPSAGFAAAAARAARAAAAARAASGLTGVALHADGPALGAVQILESSTWFLARMTIPDCVASLTTVQFTNAGNKGEVCVEGVVGDADSALGGGAGGSITRQVPVSVTDPSTLQDSVFFPVGSLGDGGGGGGGGGSGEAGGEVGGIPGAVRAGELPAAGPWSRRFTLPGPVALETEGGPRTHYKMLHAPTRLLEMYFWKEKNAEPKVVRSYVGLDAGFG